jgi:hypothetical protein
MLSRRSGVERSAAPIPECVLGVSFVERMWVWAYENGLGHPQLRSLFISNVPIINWEMGRTFRQHPAERSWQLVKPVQDRNCQSEKSLPGQLPVTFRRLGTLTVRFLNWMSREDGALAFRICDHSRLGYVMSEIRDSKGRIYDLQHALNR